MRLEINALAALIRGRFDFCLMDAPSGMGGGFQWVLSAADKVLVVAGADALSRRDAQRVAMELGAFPSDAARLIVNRVKPAPFHTPETTIDDVMDEVGLPLMGLVPDDAAFARALRRGLPVTMAEPRSAASRACARIARRMVGESVKIPRLYR
jgi:septum site-determining protein MinD